MRKGVVLIFAILVFAVSVAATHKGEKITYKYSIPESYDCSESDNAYDIYNKGTLGFFTDVGEKKFEDHCRDFRFLLEYSCDNSIAYEPLTVYCDDGCQNGACINLEDYKKISTISKPNVPSIGRETSRYPTPQPGVPEYKKKPEYVSKYYSTDVHCKANPGSGDELKKGSIEVVYADGRIQELVDMCWGPRVLREHSCDYNNPLMPAYVFCDGVCRNGACVSWKLHDNLR